MLPELSQAIKDKNVKLLSKFFFNIDLTPNQENIVKIIAYTEDKRICVNAYTRYGKSLCIAIGICLFIWLNNVKKIALIAPTDAQTSIIRNYIADLIIKCNRLSNLVDIERDSSIERLKKEASRKRWTFKNGCELRTLSAHHEANTLLGFGADLIIVDESALISREAYAKIMRMLGDDPENAVLIELSNPWDTDTQYYEHFISGRFTTIHIGYEIGLQEKRITKEFVEEMRLELAPLAFTVLYESNFPEQSEDSIFNLQWYNNAINSTIDLSKEQGKIRISCDPADKGQDFTVIYWGKVVGNIYELQGYYSEATSDNMGIASKIYSIYKEINADEIYIDGHGLGVGVISRLKQIKQQNNEKYIVKECMFGGKALNDKVYTNLKAENYFRLRNILKEGRIKLKPISQLMSELMKIKWKQSNSERIVIEDPEKSPDFSDNLVYFCWKDNNEVSFF